MASRSIHQSRPRRLGPQLAVLVIALVVTCAGLLALGQADALTATGRKIKNLEDQRARLHEQRAEALLRLAAATDPRTLGARAAAQGFREPDGVSYVRVPGLPDETQITFGASPASPLTILLDSASTDVPRDPSRLLRMMAVAPRSAAASGSN